MGFLSHYSGSITVYLTDLVGDGTEYWVKIKKTLTATETDRAEDLRTSATNVTRSAGRSARGIAARRRAGRSTPEDEETIKTLVNVNTGAYKQALLEAAITDWNITDEREMLLPLVPAAAKARSIGMLPTVARDRIFEAVEETMAAEERDEDAEADFRDGLPVGGEFEEDGSSAVAGHLGEGGVLQPAWADA